MGQKGTVMRFDLGNVAMVVVVCILIGGVGYYGYRYMIREEILEEAEVAAPYWGNINFKVSETDALGGAAHTSAGVVFKYHTNEPADEIGGVSITTSGTVIEMDPTQKGYCWISTDLGTDEYALAKWLEPTFKVQNPRIREVKWKDITGDDLDEMLVKVWLGDLQKGTTDPVWTMKMPWFDEDVASYGDDNPADQTGISLTAGTEVTVTWKLNGITAEDAGVIGKIYFVTNDTREGNDIRLTTLKLYGAWTIKGQTAWAAPTGISAGAYEAYYFQPVEYTDPVEGILVYRETNAADALYLDLKCKMYFESADAVLVDLYIELIAADGATTQVNDQVMLTD